MADQLRHGNEVQGRCECGGDTLSRDEDGNKDVRGTLGCILAVTSIVLVAIGYLMSVRRGIAFTFMCTPLLIVAIILSWQSMTRGDSGRLGHVGIVVGVGALVCLWLFGGVMLYLGMFVALNPSGLDSLGPLAGLNWF